MLHCDSMHWVAKADLKYNFACWERMLDYHSLWHVQGGNDTCMDKSRPCLAAFYY